MNELLVWLVAAIKGETSLAALGGLVFPDCAPEGAKNPCLVYQLFGDESEAVLDAGALRSGTLAYQVRIYGDSRAEANALREAFRQRFQGMSPVEIGGGWRIEGSAWGNLADDYDERLKDYGALGVLECHLAK
ncbi:hypothetical protein OJ996_24600 [Luteolibacter sp. GHJ8]|uniref:DUF3168 domain-containing protein n=1 Tax=Luteolibacter rhizosphaerae TaxID=2989719 RepID=A0ABT3GAC4_9BACT|nr:hypothetical protein [Luteolibacter rhizosphaerae]MCW1916791.1 hypothetical protein [Luteolibacter rhizosphaerae]